MSPHATIRSWQTHGLPPSVGLRLRSAGLLTESGEARLDDLVAELDDLVTADRGDIYAGFMSAAASWTDYRDRYATWRLLEQHRPPQPPPPPRPPVAVPEPVDPLDRRRPLTDLEIALVRFTSLHRLTQRVTIDNRRSRTQIALIGLLDAGCTTNEVSIITPAHVERDSTGAAIAIESPGATSDHRRARPAAAPRRVPIPDWCQPTIDELLASTPTTGVLVDPAASTDGPGQLHAVQRRIVAVVDDVFTHAGLASDPTVDPTSIRNTAGRAAYLAHGLEAALELLGDRDPNRLRREIGIRPHPPRRTT
jgi:hypothetical protein